MPAKSMFDLLLEGKELEVGDLTGTELLVVERFNTGTNAQETCVLTLHTLKQWLALPDICTPTSLIAPFFLINDFIYEIPYRIDYGDAIGDIGFYSLDGVGEINPRAVIAVLLANSPDFTDLVVGGAGGIAPFQYLQSTGEFFGGNSGEPSWTGDLPVTIHLLTFADADFVGSYDFVAEVFGESVSVHACSANNWPSV